MESNDSLIGSSLLSPIGENLEVFNLIWLDLSTNEIYKNHDMQQQLRTIINYLKLFEDIEDCEQYIQSLSKDDRIVMLIHEKFAKDILERIHELRQITSIYIYDTADLHLMDQYKKIKSIQFDLNDLVNQMKIDHIKRKKLEEPLILNIFDPNQSSDRLSSIPITTNSNTQFLHSQLLIHFLLHTKLTAEQILENKKELIELCKNEYHENLNQLKILNEFEHNYSPSNALWWYTLDSFVYELVTKSLNSFNIDLLYLLQFLIQDLIRELSHYQSTKIERVYRSSILSNEEFQLLEQSIGKYMSINRFYTTFLNREHALDYFHDYEIDINMKKLLFKIDVNPRLNQNKPFANITVHSQIADEEKILFSLGSIFRIENIVRIKNDIYVVHLNFVPDEHSHLKSFFDHIKSQYGDNETNLLSFGNALRRMGKLDEAEKCYQRVLLDSTYDQNLISRSYHHLGRLAEIKGDYDISLDYLHRSLEIKLKIMKSTDPSIAQSYNSIGIVYQEKNELEKALDAFNKALMIWKRVYGRNHPNVAGCYNNMGVVYKREKKYIEALECFQRALQIREKHPFINNHDLAGSHNNIGAVYERLGHHELAVEHYNISLKIKTKSLPPQHPSIASTLENLGYVYENRGAYLQSLSYLEKAAAIYRQTLSSTHHDVIQIEQSIQRVSSKLDSNI